MDQEIKDQLRSSILDTLHENIEGFQKWDTTVDAIMAIIDRNTHYVCRATRLEHTRGDYSWSERPIYSWVMTAPTREALLEKMAKERIEYETEIVRGEYRSVRFGTIIHAMGEEGDLWHDDDPDYDNEIIASKAWQNRLAEEQAERDADAAEELRISEEAERLREEAEREERTIYILSYSDGMYPEDNTIIATFGNEDAAKERMRLEVSSWMTSHGPRNHHTKEYNYTITEQEII